jgi:hypothetical protein
MPPTKKINSKSRYHPFPLHPTFEQYKTQRSQWDDLQFRLFHYQSCYKADEVKEQFTIEKEEIRKEQRAWLKQACDKSQWESGTADDTFQNTLECVADEECQEKQGYCLTVGRTHLFMCKLHFDTLDFETDDLFLVNLRNKMPGMSDRALNPDNWCKEDYEGDHKYTSIEDVQCSDTDVCWYHNNTDRLSGYSYSYRLKGTEDIYFCDVCWDNHYADFSVHMTSLIEDADFSDDE